MRSFVAHALESSKNRFERLRKLHQPNIGKFCANRQMILSCIGRGDCPQSPAGGSVNRPYQFDHERATERLRLPPTARADCQTAAAAARRIADDGAASRFGDDRTSTVP